MAFLTSSFAGGINLYLVVTLADAKSGQVVETITATREHPFFVEGQGFVPAGGLAVGNAIVTRAGPALVVKSIQWQRRPEGYTVYNFVVGDNHTYFVGHANGGVWVHNPLNCPITNPVPDRFARVYPGKQVYPTLGPPSRTDVFVTDATHIAGMDSRGIADALTIPHSPDGFTVVEFPSSSVSNIASPINRPDPGFVGGGLTAGGAPEFVIPNGPLPPGAITRYVP